MNNVALGFTLTCWATFYVYWMVSAFGTKRTSEREAVSGMLSYRLLTMLGVLLLLEAGRLHAPLNEHLIPTNAFVAGSAMALSVLGLAICVWARRTLGKNWSSVVVVKQEHELVQVGPYRFVRHPIYTGIITMFVGSVLLEGRLGALLGLVVFAASFVIKLRREEAVMLRQFPTQYPAYMKRSKRLVPFVV